MAVTKNNISSLSKIYSSTVQYLRKNPLLYLPFLIFGAVEALALTFLFLIPRAPLKALFGPPIRVFWNERFLHYPTNFVLLPKLAYLSRMCLTIILSSLLTGVVVALVADIYHNRHLKFFASLKLALKKYAFLFLIVFVITFILFFLNKVMYIALAKYFIAGHKSLLFLKPGIWLGPVLVSLNFIFAVLIQSAFIYTIPFLIIGKTKLIKSFIGSFRLFAKFFIPTVILVGLPMLIYIPVLILGYNPGFLINKVFPEFVLIVLYLSVIVNSLIIDPLVTISTAIFYLKNQEQ